MEYQKTFEDGSIIAVVPFVGADGETRYNTTVIVENGGFVHSRAVLTFEQVKEKIFSHQEEVTKKLDLESRGAPELELLGFLRLKQN